MLVNAGYSPTFGCPSRSQLLSLTVAVEGGMLILAAGLGAIVGPSLFTIAGSGLWAILGGVVMGFALFVGVTVALDSPLGRDSQFQRDIDRLTGLFQNARVSDLLLISLLAGIGEEALFRGFLLHHGSAWFGIPLGIALSSLLFGLLHALSLSYVIFATLIGVAMSVLYLWSDNLAVPMAAHAAYDFAALLHLTIVRRPASEYAP